MNVGEPLAMTSESDALRLDLSLLMKFPDLLGIPEYVDDSRVAARVGMMLAKLIEDEAWRVRYPGNATA